MLQKNLVLLLQGERPGSGFKPVGRVEGEGRAPLGDQSERRQFGQARHFVGPGAGRVHDDREAVT